ncbi:fibronectin type III domain-containing protein [Candidatus Micrarchaeota archaeon]|nr:fibronectin type III domain-containing protein [Candidatus Micrarchaeota archaeon]MBU1681371.1 fibronectin type III domain-containing protein [Candidatus Micrarchaeota archaeon]
MSLRTLLSFSIVLIFLLGCVSGPADDSLPRDLEIRINDGKAITTSSNVELLLFARNAAACRLSNDGATWNAWENYSREKSWVLEEADGIKQVSYQCRSFGGGLSPIVSSSIELDSTPPTIILSSPVAGQTYYDSLELVFKVIDPASDKVLCSAVIGNDILDLGVLHTDVQQSILIGLSEGEKTITLNCSDKIHTSAANVSIILKKKPFVSFAINGGSDYTDNKNVTLDLLSTTASQCRFSRDNLQWGDWEEYQPVMKWVLQGSDGKKKVYVQCRDSNNVESDTIDDTISLDTKPPPYISLKINNGVEWTSSSDVTLGLYAYSASECRLSHDDQNWGSWEPYSTKKNWKLSSGEGEKTVYYECKNKTGGDLGIASAQISYSAIPQMPPSSLSIKINDGDEYASSENLQLSLGATGAFECRLREGNLDWSAWENHISTKTFTISGNDGAKTIYYQCRNNHGTTTVFDRIYLDRKPPSEPKSLKAEASPYSVVLSWSAASDSGSGVESYSVYRKVDSTWRWVGSVSGLSYKDEKIVSGETYDYKVLALDYNRNSGSASQVSISVPEE